MKKLLFALLATSISFSTFARSWYIKPTVGTGRTGFKSGLGSMPNETIFFKGEVAAGCQISKLRIETGLGYTNPGYKLEGLVFEDNYDRNTGQIKYYTNIENRLHYIYLPLRASYKINLTDQLSIVPAVGIAASYNISSDVWVTTTTGVPSPPIGTLLKVNKLGALSDAMISAEYDLGPISATAGISYKHMVNQIFEMGNSRFYFLSAEAGILCHF